MRDGNSQANMSDQRRLSSASQAKSEQKRSHGAESRRRATARSGNPSTCTWTQARKAIGKYEAKLSWLFRVRHSKFVLALLLIGLATNSLKPQAVDCQTQLASDNVQKQQNQQFTASVLRTRRAHSIAHLGQGSAPLQSLGSELNKPSEGSPEQAGSELGGEQGGHSNEAPLVNAEGAAQRSLRIVALIVPDAVQNNTQNVTLDCMFKFDRKLDRRLTIKWFFNDEVEPIYQWIPELNKRVYSDRYERFLDKSYEPAEDAEFMLKAYRWLKAQDASAATLQLAEAGGGGAGATNDAAERSLVAHKLNRLAKLGGRHSAQLLDSLRNALYLEPWTRFRALRLITPTTHLAGRFTCSVSSLDGDDLRSARLLVYEPAKNFTFSVSRVSPQLYNLTCSANQVFPRPTLTLFRYRAGPQEAAAQSGELESVRQPRGQRARLMAGSLRQEPLSGSQTQLTVSAKQAHLQQQPPDELATPDIRAEDANSIHADQTQEANQALGAPSVYEISTWALVDESSLSSSVTTQFECLLAIEGANYEQRQTLVLQRGWHVNSGAVAMHSTLVGLFSALASLLCLMLALVSSMLIFRLLKRHAKSRVHDAEKSPSESNNSNATQSTIRDGANRSTSGSGDLPAPSTLTDLLPPASDTHTPMNDQGTFALAHQQQSAPEVDGVYRIPVPEQRQLSQPTLTFGTRYVGSSLASSKQQQQHYYNTRQLAQVRVQHETE